MIFSRNKYENISIIIRYKTKSQYNRLFTGWTFNYFRIYLKTTMIGFITLQRTLILLYLRSFMKTIYGYNGSRFIDWKIVSQNIRSYFISSLLWINNNIYRRMNSIFAWSDCFWIKLRILISQLYEVYLNI